MINKALDAYLEEHTTDEDQLMHEVNRQTHLTTYYPRMLSGKVQGKFLEFISKMMRPESILEIGSFTGYSALALAKGLSPTGKLITIDINEELETTLRNHFSQSEHAAQIELLIGNALEIIPTLNLVFDLIFIDGDKEQYTDYYEVALEKLKPGGFMLIDNVLWSGKVFEENASSDKETSGIIALNDMVTHDPRVEQVMLSIRDGILMIRKR